MKQVVYLLSCLVIINRTIFFATAVSLIMVLVKNYDYRFFIVNMLISILVYLLECDIWDRLNEEPNKSELDKYLKMDE
jgi:hypothetical protein